MAEGESLRPDSTENLDDFQGLRSLAIDDRPDLDTRQSLWSEMGLFVLAVQCEARQPPFAAAHLHEADCHLCTLAPNNFTVALVTDIGFKHEFFRA